MTTSREIIQNGNVSFGTSGVRGLVTDLNDQLCMAFCLGFMDVLKHTPPRRVALGIDLRPSSPRIAAACAAAIRCAGAEVVYCGALPTPALALFAMQSGIPAIMVTGSHIPFDRNGIKFYRAEGEISKADETAIVTVDAAIPSTVQISALPDPDPAALKMYSARYANHFGAGALQGMRIGFYQHSSVARDVFTDLLTSLGATVIPLGRTDQFVPIDTEAVAESDVERGLRWAREIRFDAIISTDGDADRPLLGDERGEWFRGDVVGLLTARALGIRHVVTPVTSTTALEKCGAFDSVTRTRVGSPYVLEFLDRQLAAHAAQGVAGFEANGGFLLCTDVGEGPGRLAPLPTRDAALPLIALMAEAKRRAVPLSALAQGLPARFTASDRLQEFPREASLRLMDALAASPDNAARITRNACGALVSTDTTDGLRMTFASGDIVHLRPSGNAPELRCYVESADAARARDLVNAVLEDIKAGS